MLTDCIHRLYTVIRWKNPLLSLNFCQSSPGVKTDKYFLSYFVKSRHSRHSWIFAKFLKDRQSYNSSDNEMTLTG